MTMRDFLTGIGWYVGICALGWLWVRGSRPAACPRGHTDLYHLLRWRCRECEGTALVRRMRRGRR